MTTAFDETPNSLPINLIDGWIHPLANYDTKWRLASEFVAHAVGRWYNHDWSGTAHIRDSVKTQTQCTDNDLEIAETDNGVYLQLISKVIALFESPC